MPAIAPGSKVLVTGANGFSAIHIVDLLLKKGYSVRATVRSESKGTHLKKIFGKYGDKLELVTVPDIAKVDPIQLPLAVGRRELTGFDLQDGAFDSVIDGLDAILHTASPYYFNVEDPDGMKKP